MTLFLFKAELGSTAHHLHPSIAFLFATCAVRTIACSRAKRNLLAQRGVGAGECVWSEQFPLYI
jgi:hypothetical protein